MPNFEGLPDPRHTPVTPENVAKLDPKIQEILLRNANRPRGEQEPAREPEAQAPIQPAPKKQKSFPTFIESSLPSEKDDD